METITTTRFTNCTNCGKCVNKYYRDIKFVNIVCLDCLVAAYYGRFPAGKGVYVPCSICMEPRIYWYHIATFGKRNIDCGGHDDGDYGLRMFDLE